LTVFPFKDKKSSLLVIVPKYRPFCSKQLEVCGPHFALVSGALLAVKRYEVPLILANELVIEINRHKFTNHYIGLT
jgi:tRNA1Val (adenine37-N6)-methyltransferase